MNKIAKHFSSKTYGAKASTQNTETFEVEGLCFRKKPCWHNKAK